jgi:hypothetical protein
MCPVQEIHQSPSSSNQNLINTYNSHGYHVILNKKKNNKKPVTSVATNINELQHNEKLYHPDQSDKMLFT